MRMTKATGLAIGRRIAPPRFIAFVLIGAITFAVAIRSEGWSHATLIGFDIGAVIFLLSCLPLLRNDTDGIRQGASRNDANRVMLLVITGLVSTVILVAVAVELSQKTKLDTGGIVLVVGTLLMAWLFSNFVYALHYAHLFYSPLKDGTGDAAGIDFPGDDAPDYWDFIYFAFTLGMTFQTSDVEVSSQRIRRIVILHCLAAFVFNIGILAFTINVLGGG